MVKYRGHDDEGQHGGEPDHGAAGEGDGVDEGSSVLNLTLTPLTPPQAPHGLQYS